MFIFSLLPASKSLPWSGSGFWCRVDYSIPIKALPGMGKVSLGSPPACEFLTINSNQCSHCLSSFIAHRATPVRSQQQLPKLTFLERMKRMKKGELGSNSMYQSICLCLCMRKYSIFSWVWIYFQYK